MDSRSKDKKYGRRQFLVGLATAGIGLLTGGFLGKHSAAQPKPEPKAETTVVHVVPSEQPVLIVNILDFGADPTGARDSSDAFNLAIEHIQRAVMNNPAAESMGDNNRRGRVRLYIPEGCYKIVRPESLMKSSYRMRTVGLGIQGAGRGLTQIHYTNAAPGKYLLYNQDAWLFITVSDIEFTSSNKNNNFMYSLSAGGAQNYSFERCMWTGMWNSVFRLEGSNNNSEMSWYHCNFNGDFTNAVYVPRNNSSDQFLNYNFFSCHFEVGMGDFLVFEKGGNINVWGGSFIHYGEEGGTFFKLLNAVHAQGVQRFLCVGSRFEHKNVDSRLIECEWNDGTVSFVSCDMSSQAYRMKPTVNAVFRVMNEKMSSVYFQSCMLMGKHEYQYHPNAWRFPHNIVYESCEFAHARFADEFVVFTSTNKHAYQGGQPQVSFRRCRSLMGTADSAFFDSDVGYRSSNRGTLTKKLISVKTSTGAFPMAGRYEAFLLPVGAIVLNIKFLCKPGAVAFGSNANYWIETSEAIPTRIAAVFTDSAESGFNVNADPMFECTTDAKRKLRLCSGNDVDQANFHAICLVEYVG